MPRVRIIVSADGSTAKVETKGYSGPACQQATKALEAALGETVEDVKTPEFFATVAAKQQVGQ